MSSSGWLLKNVEVDFIFIVAKVLINKLNELFKYKYQQKQSIIFCKVEIERILLFHFLVDLLPKIVQSPEKVSFSTHTQKSFYVLNFERRKSKTPPAGQVCKSQNQNQKMCAYTLIFLIKTEFFFDVYVLLI
jgi:hypothetical protein